MPRPASRLSVSESMYLDSTDCAIIGSSSFDWSGRWTLVDTIRRHGLQKHVDDLLAADGL